MNIEMTRRSFLWTGAAFGAVGAVGLKLSSIGNAEAATEADEWVFDASTGIYRNPGLSRRLRRRAALRGGRRWVTMATPRPPVEIEIHDGYAVPVNKHWAEYGTAMTLHNTPLSELPIHHYEGFIRLMAMVNRKHLKWYSLPELRAGSRYGWSMTSQMVGWYGVAAA